MANIFEYNDKSFKAFSKFYAKAPFKARRATARVLSQFAFGVRQEALKEIKKKMTIRSEKFVNSSMRFKGARSARIDDQVSATFSIGRARFSGWEEQNDGTADKRTRSQSLLARGNNFKKKVKPSVKMKPGRDFISMGDFKLPSGKAQVPAYLKAVKAKYKNKPFILKKKYKNIKRGLYKFVRNKMQILQNFEKKPRKVKRIPWMKTARGNYFRKTDIDREWIKALDFITKKKKF